MTIPLATDQDTTAFYPPTVTPPRVPLSLPNFLINFIRNPLLVVPEAVYRESVYQFGTRLTWVTDPTLIKRILLDDRDSFPKTPLEKLVLGPLLGNGLLVSSGAEWKWQRQTAAPVFRHADNLRYTPVMVSAAEEIIDIWRNGTPGATHPIDTNMSDASYRVISETMLAGSDGPAFDRSDLEKVRHSWPLAYAVLGLPAWLPYPGRSRKRRAEQRMRTAVGELVRSRRASPGARDDLVGHLLSARDPDTNRPMSDEEMVDNLLTYLVAGHATVAKALTWALYLVARSRAWERRMLEEIEQVAGPGPIKAEHVDRLTEVTKVLKEAMRLYPPLPDISRVARADVELGGKQLRAGSFILIPIFAIHRHRRLWEDPDRFDPDRFAPERATQYSRHQFMPFGAGPRTCIGASFAMIESIVMLATFVRAARFEVPAGHVPIPVSRVTLWSGNGMPLKVWPRRASAPVAGAA